MTAKELLENCKDYERCSDTLLDHLASRVDSVLALIDKHRRNFPPDASCELCQIARILNGDE